MSPEWRALLIDAGAELDAQRVSSFGNLERERHMVTTGDALCDLSHFGLIAVHGEDAPAFLQGQFSNDVSQVTATRSQPSSYCSPKGRMLVNFRLFKRDHTYYLRLPQEMLESTLKRLRLFVLRSRVVLEDASDALVRFGYCGPNAERELDEILGEHPADIDDCLRMADITGLRLIGPQPRFELYGGLESMKKLWSSLNVRGAPVGASAWALLDILAGVAQILPPTSDSFVPQMTNLQLIGGVSFKKGCYPGQEVIARVHYRGMLKRRMYRVHVDTDTVPTPNDAIFAPTDDQNQASGRIVNAQCHPDGGIAALAVLQMDRAAHELRLWAPDGPALKLEDLPYAI